MPEDRLEDVREELAELEARTTPTEWSSDQELVDRTRARIWRRNALRLKLQMLETAERTQARAEWRRLRKVVLERDPVCHYCGDEEPDQVDHVMPKTRGGEDVEENLVAACRDCNMEKLNFTPEEWRAWRIEHGYGWPPQSRFDRLEGVLAAHMGGA